MEWRFEIEKMIPCQEKNRMEDTIAVWLHCDIPRNLNEYMCGAQAKIKLVPFKDNEQSTHECIGGVYDSKTTSWGFDSFIEWKKLFTNGYIRNNAIFFEMQLIVGRLEHKDFGSLIIKPIEDKYEGEKIVEKSMKLLLNKIDDKFVATKSTQFEIDGVMWHIEISKWFLGEQEYFRFKLFYDNKLSPDWSCELSANLKLIPANADFVPIERIKRRRFDKNKKFMSVRMIEWPKLEMQFVKNDSIEMMFELKVKQHK